MPLLARKITLAKWNGVIVNEITNDDLPADTVTADLRTKSNELSTWIIDDNTCLKEAVLALAVAQERLETISVLWFPYDTNVLPFEIAETETDSIVSDMNDKHVDILNLTYIRLKAVIDIFSDAIRNKNFKRFTRGEVKKIVMKGISDKRVDVDRLDEHLKKDLGLHKTA